MTSSSGDPDISGPPTHGAAVEPSMPQDEHHHVAAGRLRSTLTRSVIWTAIERWGNRTLGLLVFILLARFLSSSQFGLVALASAFLAIFTVLTDQGFSSAIVQKGKLSRADCDTAFWMSVATGLVLTLLVVFGAPLAAQGLHEHKLTPILRALAPTLFLGSLCGTQEALLKRSFKFRSLSIRTLLSSAIGGVGGVIAAIAGAQAWSLVIEGLLTMITQVAVLWSVSSWRPGLQISRQSFHDLRHTSVMVLGIQLAALGNSQADSIIIGGFLGPVDVGYYYIANRLISVILDIQTSVIEAVSLTTLSKLRDTPERLRATFYRLTSLGSASAILVFTGICVLAPEIVPLVFGAKWSPSIHLMQILCAMGALNAIIVFDRNALIAVGASKAAFWITVVQAVIGIGFMIVGAQFGVVAVAIAISVRQYVIWPLRLRALRRHLSVRISRYLSQWFGPVVSAGCSAGVAYLASTGLRHHVSAWTYLVVQSLIVTATYVATLRYTSPATWTELARVGNSLRRRSSSARHRAAA